VNRVNPPAFWDSPESRYQNAQLTVYTSRDSRIISHFVLIVRSLVAVARAMQPDLSGATLDKK
jgi:hypothetical protein